MRTLVLALLLGVSVARPVAADRIASPVVNTLPVPTVTLLDAGKNPVKPLRFTAKKGLRKTVVAKMKMSLELDLGNGSPTTQSVPTTEMTFAVEVTDIFPNGDIGYAMKFKRPRAIADGKTPKAMVDAVDDALKGLEGLEGHSVVSSRGFVREASFEIPANAPPQAKQMFQSMESSLTQIAAPVPEEAVGVGATWETATVLNANGLTINQVATNTLISLAGNRAVLDIKVVQTAKPQKMTANGMTADLESYAASGAGKTSLDLTALVPTAARIGMNSQMKLSAAGQKLAMKLALDMVLKGK